MFDDRLYPPLPVLNCMCFVQRSGPGAPWYLLQLHSLITQMRFTHASYTVAWVCALPLELAAAKVLLDQVHPRLAQPESDHTVGLEIAFTNKHRTVITLPYYQDLSASIYRATTTLIRASVGLTRRVLYFVSNPFINT